MRPVLDARAGEGGDEGENGLDRAIDRDYPQALVLAWEGKAVPEGCDRVARVLDAEHRMAPAYTPADAHYLGMEAADLGLATVITTPGAT